MVCAVARCELSESSEFRVRCEAIFCAHVCNMYVCVWLPQCAAAHRRSCIRTDDRRFPMPSSSSWAAAARTRTAFVLGSSATFRTIARRAQRTHSHTIAYMCKRREPADRNEKNYKISRVYRRNIEAIRALGRRATNQINLHIPTSHGSQG